MLGGGVRLTLWTLSAALIRNLGESHHHFSAGVWPLSSCVGGNNFGLACWSEGFWVQLCVTCPLQLWVDNTCLCDCCPWAKRDCSTLLYLGTFACMFGCNKNPGTQDMSSL